MTYRDRLRFSSSEIDCKRALYRPGSLMERHHHDDTTVVFTLSGSFTHTMRSRATTLVPHGLLYLPAGETHADDFGRRGACCFITAIDATWVGKRFAAAKVDANGPRISTGGYLPAFVLKMYNEFKRPDSLSDLIVEGAFLELLARWFRDGADHQYHDAPGWLRSVRALLHDSFRQSVSLNDLSQAAGVHSSQIAREFHRVYGQTVGEYLRKLRVNFVAERLRSADEKLSLTDLALHAGFSSHAHMSSVFKRLTGMTPSEYKKAH